MPLWLRYNDKSMILPSGQLFVGRSAECHVVVSDPLASRRHAMITMSQMGAFVTDLGSKAGVMVNGLLISGARRLQTGDTIQIAGSRLVVENVELPEEEEPTDPRMRSTISPPAFDAGSGRLAPTLLGIPRVQPLRMTPPGDTLDEEDEEGRRRGFARTMEAPRVTILDTTRAGQRWIRALARSARRGPKRPTRRAQGSRQAPAPAFPRPENLRSLAIAAEKALVMGRAEDAERIMQRSLLDTRDASDHGEVDSETAELGGDVHEPAGGCARRGAMVRLRREPVCGARGADAGARGGSASRRSARRSRSTRRPSASISRRRASSRATRRRGDS
ncbi:MAG: FHA domain-containing protein [Polyangiaceae bacterium]